MPTDTLSQPNPSSSQAPVNDRLAEYPVDEQFLRRWSPRAMSGEAVSRAELDSLFEAARWAPSAFNDQPWRFFYALRDSEAWPLFFEPLVPFNQEWVEQAGALILIASRTSFERNDKPSRTHSFDTGAAWMSLFLQAQSLGLVCHGMSGFDYQAARVNLNIPETFALEAMAAIGRPGDPNQLSDALRDVETPSKREPIEARVFEGEFPS